MSLKARILIYTLCSFGILSLNCSNYSVLADGVIPEFGITYTQSGLIVSILAVSYAAVQIPSGIANDRYGGIRVLAMSLAIVVASGMAFSLAGSYAIILVTRVTLGMGAGSIIASCIKLLSSNFPTDEMDRANGIFVSGGGMGFICIFLVIPSVMEFSGWRGGLYLSAGLTFLLLVLMPVFLRGASSGVKTFPEKASALPSVGKSKIVSRNLIACIVVNFTGLSILNGTMTWAALYLQDKYQVSLVVAGVSVAVLGLANIFGAFTGGIAASKFGRKVVILATMAGCVAAPLLFIPSHLLFIDMVIVGAVGWFGISYFGPTAAIVTTSVDKKRVGLTFGIFHTLGCMGIFFAPLSFGYVLDVTGNFNAGFLFLGLTALAGVVAALMIKKVE